MRHSLFDIIIFVIIVGSLTALIWEMIPEGIKKYWEYASEIRRDRRKEER